MNERQLAVGQALRRLSPDGVNAEIRPGGFLQIGEGLTPRVTDLFDPQINTLLPQDVGFGFPDAGQHLIVQVDPRTRVVLERKLHGTTTAHVFVDGQHSRTVAFDQPVVMGNNPQFASGERRNPAQFLPIPEASEQTTLLLSPVRRDDGRIGYLVGNMTNHPIMLDRVTTTFPEVSDALHQMGLQSLPPLSETDRQLPPLASGLAIESKAPGIPSEDVAAIRRNTFMVLDGIGGHGNGLGAATRGAGVILDYERDSLPPTASVRQVVNGFRQALIDANRQVLQLDKVPVQTANGVVEREPGATAVIGRIVYGEGPTGIQLVLGFAGDTRAYIQHPNGGITQLTKDDNLQREFARRGIQFVISGDQYGPFLRPVEYPGQYPGSSVHTITEELADKIDGILDIVEDPELLNNWDPTNQAFNSMLRGFYRMRNQIFNALGGGLDQFVPRVEVFDVLPGSIVWATSDGIHDAVTKPYLYDVFREASQLPLDQRAQHVLNKVHEWNEAHKDDGLRFKIDDKAVIFIIIPALAA